MNQSPPSFMSLSSFLPSRYSLMTVPRQCSGLAYFWETTLGVSQLSVPGCQGPGSPCTRRGGSTGQTASEQAPDLQSINEKLDEVRAEGSSAKKPLFFFSSAMWNLYIYQFFRFFFYLVQTDEGMNGCERYLGSKNMIFPGTYFKAQTLLPAASCLIYRDI